MDYLSPQIRLKAIISSLLLVRKIDLNCKALSLTIFLSNTDRSYTKYLILSANSEILYSLNSSFFGNNVLFIK